MALVLTDFDKIWASTSPLTPYSYSESNYKEGWNFVGGTPPARQMWDSIQQLNDEKLQYLYNVGDGFLEKLIGAFASDLDSLPAGTAFTATTALSKMISEMNTEDGVVYDLSNSSAWYICLGAKFGNLIIQGGYTTSFAQGSPTSKTVTLAISFSNDDYRTYAVPATSAYSADWHLLYPVVVRTGSTKTTSSFEVMYYNATSSGHVGAQWLAFGL